MPPPPFNPQAGLWGVYASQVPLSSLPDLWVGHASCNEQGFLLGVLYHKTGHTGVWVAANYGPWVFSTIARQAVKDVQAFFGHAQTGYVDQATWVAIRACANA